MVEKPESRLQRAVHTTILDAFKKRWGFKVHGNEFMRKGLPDRIYCIEGLFFAFEVKMPGEEPTELQKYEIECIREAGGVAAVVETPQEAIKLVRATLARTKGRR